MFIRLLILFTIIPVVEIYVLISAGRQIGIAPTIALILATGIAGAFLARTQGFTLLSQIQQDLSQGIVPQEKLLDGAMILAGGLLLLTPGFCTDLFGFCLLTPLTRHWIKKSLKGWLEERIRNGQIHINRY
jgi:UPF0716 protein FxsA